MTWLISAALMEAYENSLSLPGRVGASSEVACSAGKRYAQLNVMPTPHKFWHRDRTMEPSDHSRYGLTCVTLTEHLGAALLTWCQAASHVRTSALPAKAQASQVSAPGSGLTWRGSLAKFDPVSRSWKTAQLCLLGDSELSSVTWPRSGMTAAGQCWELPMLERRTAANDSGLLPTPLASNTKAHHMRSGGRPARSYIPTPIATEWKNGCGKTGNRAPEKSSKAGMKLGEFAKMWPTPTVCGNYNRKGASSTSGDGLATAVAMWPTPLANSHTGAGHGPNKKGAPNLQTVVAMHATPTARDWRSGKASQATHDRNSRPLSEQIGGSLNPTWVEWLMGWPLGWTDLKPLATDKSHYAPLKHGESSPETCNE